MRACVIRRTAGLDQVEIAELRAPSARSPWVVRRQGGLERHMKEHDDRGPKLAPPLVQPLDGVDGRVGASDVDGGPTRSRGASARWLSFLAGLFVVLGVGTGLAWLLRPHPIPPGHPGHFNAGPTPVVAASVQTGALPVTLTALGTVTPLATVTVKTQISGRLVKVAFREGQTVRAGDLLALIDPRPYEIALAEAKAQLQRDQALVQNAEVDLARYRTLVTQDALPVQQLDTQQSLVRQLQGTVAGDQARVDSAKLNLEYCGIRAPVSGRVGLRLIDPGNYVQASDGNGIVVITQLQPISVIFTLPEDNLPLIMKRFRSGSALRVTAYDRTLSSQLAVGTLATVDNQIDTTTGMVKLRAHFANDDLALFPNQFVTTTLLVDVLRDATIVPTAAIQRGAPGTFVYVVSPQRTVSVRPVTLGPTDGERVAIQSGLTPGDQVVVDGADKLRDGAKVAVPIASGVEGTADGATPRPHHRRREASDAQR